MKRKPLTKDQLLPMSTDKVRSLSLEGHIALSVLRRGDGDAMQIGCLARILYLSYFMRDMTEAGSDIEQFRVAEIIVEDCIARAARAERWELKHEDYSAIERILLLYDAQLAAAPAYRFSEACQQFLRVVVNTCRTPIDSSRIQASTVSTTTVENWVRDASGPAHVRV